MAKKKAYKEFGQGLGIGSPTKIAIGIDQSYSGFGITFMDLNSDGYKTIVFKGESTGVDRLVDISVKLGNLLEQYVPEKTKEVVVAMEGYAFGSQMANMAGELGAVVKLTLRDYLYKHHGAYPYIIPPTVLKKYATGKGAGIQKNQILLHVFKKWGVEFNDDNAADSYVLAHLAAGKGNLAYEREIYHNIQDPKYREK
jgi:crossover junction endodeoxyribonuclease RuvC